MKRLIGLLLIVLMVSSCGSTTPNDSSNTMPSDSSNTMPSDSSSTMPSDTNSPTPNSTGKPIVVASKDFTEEFIVGEMYALLLEGAGLPVERKINLGGTPIAHEALVQGQIDLYPEYTSTGLLTVLKQSPLSDPNEIYQAVKSGYESQYQLTWLEPSPFNDTQGLATTKAIAQQHNISSYSDLSAKAGELRLGAPAEFTEREDGIKGLQSTYGGFEFQEVKQLGTGPLRYDALKNGDIDVVVVFTTDARIAADDLLVLKDDKTLYPIYNIAPVVRQDTLSAYPQIAEILNKLAPLLTDEVITKLNAQVDIDGNDYTTVAKDFLKQQGLIQ
jgi:osmoprotectant transport system substrate-binding protein